MHKAGDSMERLEFNDYEDFACEVADTFEDIRKNDDFDDIAIIAHYDDAKHIIRKILCLGYDINSIELKNPELGYDDVPYVVSVCGIESEYEVWCEPMVRDNGKYIDDESSIIYVLDNCSSEVLKHLDSECIFEVGIDDDDNCSCGECECACKKDEKTAAASKESYFINGKSVDKSEFDKKYEEFEEKYMDNIRDMMLNYCTFMDEVNDWRSRLLRW